MPSLMKEAYNRIAEAATSQGQREHVEALGMLEAASWFDNFGYEYYQARMHAIQRIVRSLGYIPDDYEELAEHAATASGMPYQFQEGE